MRRPGRLVDRPQRLERRHHVVDGFYRLARPRLGRADADAVTTEAAALAAFLAPAAGRDVRIV